MTAGTYVYRDGARLTPAMLYDIERLDDDFYKAFRLHILVSSGIRFRSEQEAIFFKRYVHPSKVNGRRVYDRRWYKGILWARIDPAGTVAAPDSPLANHVLENTGSGAVDLRDTGSDPGIMTKGSVRDNWLHQIVDGQPRIEHYNYSNEGDSFGERWHKKYLLNPWRAVPSGGGPKPLPVPPKPKPPTPTPIPMEDDMRFIYVRGTDSNAIYQVDLATGRSSLLTLEKWQNIAKAYENTGRKPPISTTESTQAQLLAAWPLA